MSFQAVEKLDVLTKSNKGCLFNILNLCVTNPGKRELKNRLLAPITCPHKLNQSIEGQPPAQKWISIRLRAHLN